MVAMRTALAFPDVFHGAVLNAGSDPFGDEAAENPLLRKFYLADRLRGRFPGLRDTGWAPRVAMHWEDGAVVLNADDPRVLAMTAASRAGRRTKRPGCREPSGG